MPKRAQKTRKEGHVDQSMDNQEQDQRV